MYIAEGAETVGGPLLAHLDRRQKARPQCLRSHPRGVRGEASGADHRDENRTGRVEAAESGRHTPAAGAGEGQEERPEESGEKEKVKESTTRVSITRYPCRFMKNKH